MHTVHISQKLLLGFSRNCANAHFFLLHNCEKGKEMVRVLWEFCQCIFSLLATKHFILSFASILFPYKKGIIFSSLIFKLYFILQYVGSIHVPYKVIPTGWGESRSHFRVSACIPQCPLIACCTESRMWAEGHYIPVVFYELYFRLGNGKKKKAFISVWDNFLKYAS